VSVGQPEVGWLERRVALGLSIAFLIVIGVAVWTYRIERLVRASAAGISEARDVLKAVDRSSALLDELDAAQRGYLVTGEPRLLASYEAAKGNLAPSLAELRRVTAHNPRQAAAMPLLASLAEQKVAFVGQVLQQRRERGLDYAAALMATNRGEELKARSRAVLDGMRAEEDRLLREETRLAARLSDLKLVVLGVGILLQMGFFVAVYILVRRDITERGQAAAAIAERVQLATFAADVGAALTHNESFPRALAASAEAMVRHLGVSIAGIWVMNSRAPVLERRALAGGGADSGESPERIPFGPSLIGRIAAEGVPRIEDLTRDSAEAGEAQWARGLGMVSFAGHPLAVAGRSIGVLAMFSAEKITEPSLRALGTVADAIALGIDRERAALSLRTSETLTRSIVEGMLDGLVTVDATSRIKSFNLAAEQMFGYAREELIGKPLSLIVPETEGASEEQFLQMTQGRLEARVTEVQGRRKDGTAFPYELALFEFWTSEGRHFGGSLRDLSERQEVDRLKREFVSTVSHELRTPLTSIRGALGLVAGGAAGTLPAQAKTLLDIALKNSERLTRLVNDILDMEKIEAGQLEFRMEDLELAPLVASAVEETRAYGEPLGVSLAIENEAPRARVRADPDRFSQALTNLISNAVKYTPRGGTVRLITTRREGSVRLAVVDRGPGIPEEFRSRIFGRFQQADSSDTRQKGGSGLGLAITRLIVEKLGGVVGFDTELGRGSTFWIEIPALDPAAERPADAPHRGDERRLRILHVDDDPDLPTIVALALSEVADVDVARSLREARQRLADTAYDLVVLDFELPDGDGLELAPELDRAGLSAPTPYILFTAHDVSTGLAGKAVAILVKSRSSVAELVRLIRHLFPPAATEVPTLAQADR
jgi:PAS domain S-box-containing protein